MVIDSYKNIKKQFVVQCFKVLLLLQTLIQPKGLARNALHPPPIAPAKIL